jgi:hypothetical protein
LILIPCKNRGSQDPVSLGIKNTKFVKDLPIIDAQFRFNQCNSFREEYISVFNIGPYGKNVSKRFFSETTWTIETKLPRNDHWKVLYKVYVFFMPIGNPRWLPPQVIVLTQNHMGKIQKYILL